MVQSPTEHEHCCDQQLEPPGDNETCCSDRGNTDVDTAETFAGVVGLFRQAALRAWAATDRAGARSPGQPFAFGVDLAADQARHLFPNGTDIDGPVPVGGGPAGLLRLRSK